MKYLYLLYADESQSPKPGSPELQAQMDAYDSYFKEITEKDLIRGGDGGIVRVDVAAGVGFGQPQRLRVGEAVGVVGLDWWGGQVSGNSVLLLAHGAAVLVFLRDRVVIGARGVARGAREEGHVAGSGCQREAGRPVLAGELAQVLWALPVDIDAALSHHTHRVWVKRLGMTSRAPRLQGTAREMLHKRLGDL